MSTQVPERIPVKPHTEMEFHRLLDKLPAAAYTCDADGLITYYNRRAMELWGRAPQLHNTVDRYCGSFKLYTRDGAPMAHDQCWMALALRHGKEYNGHEVVIEHPDGSRWSALAHANPFYDDLGKVSGAVNVLVDITDRKHTEEALRQADRRKNEFLAILAHELRNPLAPLRNALQILQMAGSTGPEAAAARGMMERQLGHMVRLIDDLLDLSRITQGKIELRRERWDLSLIIQDAVETSRSFIDEAGHRLTVSLPAQPVFVYADRTRLSQVFANLLNNSSKYTERGGKIDLSVEPEGDTVLVKVSDTGIGIPREMQSRIFDMFTQVARAQERTQSGLGIGLSVVRGLVELHGGSVEVASEGEGQGAEFVVRLSAAPMAVEDSRPSVDDDATDRTSSRHRILVVDDNKDAANSLGMMLQIMGHEIRTVYDGFEAVEVASSFRPDVILLDIGLPKMNGYDVCRRIRSEPWSQQVVVIALTGWSQDEDKRQSKEAGFNFHITKPVDPQALGKLLAGVLPNPS